MERHESQDLDGIIDEVARAMTSVERARDLRPAVASRIASVPSWTMGWRVGMAAAAMAAIAFVAVVVRPVAEPERAPSSATAGGQGSVTAAPHVPQRVESASAESVAAVARPARVVVRQRLVDRPPTEEVVEIAPLAIGRLEADPLAPSQQVLITPIDLEPVSIGELELVE